MIIIINVINQIYYIYPYGNAQIHFKSVYKIET